MAIFKGRGRELIQSKIAKIKARNPNGWQPGGRIAQLFEDGPGFLDPETGGIKVQHQFEQPQIPWTAIAIGGAALLTVLFATRR